MRIETSRCIVRNFTMDDVEDLYKTLSDEKVMEYIEPAYGRERVKEFIKEAGLCEPPLVFALVWKETGEVIGQVIFHPYEEDSYEIGWIIRREYWGKGIAGEINPAVPFLFSAYAGCTVDGGGGI